MATVVQGKRIIYLFREYSKRATKAGVGVAFVTENERTKSRDSDSTATKDGNVVTAGSLEHEVTASYLESVEASTDSHFTSDDLESCIDNNSPMEIWEANLDKAGSASGTYKGRYMQGYITDWTRTSAADEAAEGEVTFSINGTGAVGDVTVSQEIVDAATYVFTDTPATGA